jgi:hypothetical protein
MVAEGVCPECPDHHQLSVIMCNGEQWGWCAERNRHWRVKDGELQTKGLCA